MLADRHPAIAGDEAKAAELRAALAAIEATRPPRFDEPVLPRPGYEGDL